MGKENEYMKTSGIRTNSGVVEPANQHFSAHSCNPDWMILPPTQHWYSVCVCVLSQRPWWKTPFKCVTIHQSSLSLLFTQLLSFLPHDVKGWVNKTPWSPEWVELFHFQVPSSMAIKENDGSSNGRLWCGWLFVLASISVLSLKSKYRNLEATLWLHMLSH
jgi:hypothetical protein